MPWYLFVWIPNTVTLIMRLVTLVTYWNTRVVKKMGDIFEGTPIFWNIEMWRNHFATRARINTGIYFCFDKWQIDRQSIWEWKEDEEAKKNMVTVPREKLTENFSTAKQRNLARYNYCNTWLLRPPCLVFKVEKYSFFPFVHANSCQNIHQNS